MAIFGGKQLRAPTTRVNHSAARRQGRHCAVKIHASFKSVALSFPRNAQSIRYQLIRVVFRQMSQVKNTTSKHSGAAVKWKTFTLHNLDHNFIKKKYSVSRTYDAPFYEYLHNSGPIKMYCRAIFRVSLNAGRIIARGMR